MDEPGGRVKMDDRFAYTSFGLRFRSAIALPEIACASVGDANHLPLVDVELGSVPDTLATAPDHTTWLQAGPSEVLLKVKDTARYLVREGRQIVVDPAPGASALNVRLYLLGSALGALCHQRGLLPLHANAIVAGGEAFAFVGASGAGKSTLAAYFMRAGYEVLCDDVCVVSFDSLGRPQAWPGVRRLKLWGDAAAALGHDCQTLERAADGRAKFQLPLPGPGGKEPFPLRAIYVLNVAEAQSISSITRLEGAAAFAAILSNTYRDQFLGPMGLRQRHFEQVGALLRHAQVFSAARHWGYDVFDRESAKLETHLIESIITGPGGGI